MKLFVDDVRDPSFVDHWEIARTFADAEKLIRSGEVTHISLDHDLGEEKTGYDLACLIEELAVSGKIPFPDWRVHSANPVGKMRIQQALISAERYIENAKNQ